MNDMQQKMYNALCKLSGEEVARLFLDWLGLQVMDADFRMFLGNEGVMDEYVEDAPSEEEDDNEEFYHFCGQFPGCTGCPFESKPDDECEERFRQMKSDQYEK